MKTENVKKDLLGTIVGFLLIFAGMGFLYLYMTQELANEMSLLAMMGVTAGLCLIGVMLIFSNVKAVDLITLGLTAAFRKFLGEKEERCNHVEQKTVNPTPHPPKPPKK